jgi:hypothetical protein
MAEPSGGKCKDKTAVQVRPQLAEKGLETGERSLLSNETESQVSDPVASWVDDSQVAEGPPTKIARVRGPLERVEVEEVISSEDEEEMGLGGEQDLQLEATAVAPLAQGRRSLAITYSSRKKNGSTSSLPMRKSSRTGAMAGTPIMELA